MSAKALYRVLGLKGYEIVAIHESDTQLDVVVECPRNKWQCPDCGSHHVHLHDWGYRRWRNVPIGLQRTYVSMAIPRVECQNCEACRRIKVKFAQGITHHTKAYERYAADLLKYMTPQDFARREGVSWDTANAIDQRRLKKVPQVPLRSVTRIAIDEVYLGDLHGYMTVVLDLTSKQVIHCASGRGSESLRSFVKKLRRSQAKIQAVAIDMAGGYIKAVKEFLPEAKLVFDRFHIVKRMNEKLTELRRDEYAKATCQKDKDILKGTRWLLLRKNDSLSKPKSKLPGSKTAKFAAEQRRLADQKRLQAALDLNQNLATAYIMKGELDLIWEFATKSEAEDFLRGWCRRAVQTGIRVLETMAKTLLKHAEDIVNWYDEQISTAALEGTNNKIKLLQRRAYGYRNKKHLILRIQTLHTTRTVLTG